MRSVARGEMTPGSAQKSRPTGRRRYQGAVESGSRKYDEPLEIGEDPTTSETTDTVRV